MPLVLVQNESTVGGAYDHWKNIEGVQYQFPNKYIGKVKQGKDFIYYRGVRRANSKRASPEYFGCGKIGRVWLDPETDTNLPRKNWHWYCEIVDYVPFKSAVPFKKNDVHFEDIPKNFWGVAVRNISEEVYGAILRAGGQSTLVVEESEIQLALPVIVPMEEVQPILLEKGTLITPTRKSNKKGSAFTNGSRRTRFSKLYGDRAEEIVYRLLQNYKYQKLRWVAKEQETPGWDIEYVSQGELFSIEVKGTSGKSFTSIELTAGEWKAASERKSNYHLYLVADCLSKEPKVQVIENPYKLFLEEKIVLEPLIWKMTF